MNTRTDIHRQNAKYHFQSRLLERFKIEGDIERLQGLFEHLIGKNKPLRPAKDNKWLFRAKINNKTIGVVYCPILNCFVTAIYLKRKDWI